MLVSFYINNADFYSRGAQIHHFTGVVRDAVLMKVSRLIQLNSTCQRRVSTMMESVERRPLMLAL